MIWSFQCACIYRCSRPDIENPRFCITTGNGMVLWMREVPMNLSDVKFKQPRRFTPRDTSKGMRQIPSP